jgi:hypothetical protein
MNDQPRAAAGPRRALDGPSPRLLVAGLDGTDASANALAQATGLASIVAFIPSGSVPPQLARRADPELVVP